MALDNYTTRWIPRRLISMSFTSIGINWHKIGREIGTDAVEAGTTTTVINATAHSAIAGDVIVMTSGGEDGEAIEVLSVTANAITLISALSGAPSALETFTILRPTALTKEVILQFDSSLDSKVLIQESQTLPTFAFTGIRANADKSFDLKSNNLHSGANNDFDDHEPFYLWVKVDDLVPTDGELDITLIGQGKG